jgi:heat shock protein HslJ/uncharacterized lipoprotein YbaY
MPRLSASGAAAGLAALLISTAAIGQEDRLLSGSVTYLDRMALPPGATVLVDLFGLDQRVLAESRTVTDGEQVPIPFEIAVPAEAGGTLRAGIATGGRMIWISEPLAIAPDTPADLGEIVLSRHQPMGFASAFRCGGQTIRVGFAGDDAVMDTGAARVVLKPVPAASGARYEAEGDPDTWFWNQGDNALVSIEGTELPECQITFPMDETPYRASGNEPFWSLVIEAGEMTLTRLGMDDLTMPVTETGMTDTGQILVIAADPERALRTVILRDDTLCRDTMTGMPHPETVSVSMGDNTITGCGGDPWALLTGRTWVVEDIGGAGVIDTARATLGFLPTGRVFGNDSCNRYMGPAVLTGETLTFGALATTMMACPEAMMAQERRFLDALAQVTGFDIDATGALILRGPDGALITARAATDGSAP